MSHIRPIHSLNDKKISPPHCSEGEFHRIGREALKTLAAVPSLRDQEAYYHKVGGGIVQRTASWKGVEERSLALMLDSAVIENTSYEGNTFRATLAHWKQLISHLQQGEAHFLSMNFPIDAFVTVLDELETISHLVPTPALKTYTEGELEVVIDKFFSHVRPKLENNEVVYVPTGYRSTLRNPGHIMMLKIKIVKDEVYLILLNLGDGAERHPPLKQEATHQKYSYQYYPIAFPKQAFLQGELGKIVMGQLFRYMHDRVEDGNTVYSASHIYDLFLAAGRLVPKLHGPLEALEAKLQTKPSCTEKALKNCAKDFAMERNISQIEVRRFFFNQQLSCLLSGFHTYQNNPSVPLHTLWMTGHDELQLKFLKLHKRGWISTEEKATGYCMLHAMRTILLPSPTEDPSLITHIVESARPQEKRPAPQKNLAHATTHKLFQGLNAHAISHTAPFTIPKPVAVTTPYMAPTFSIDRCETIIEQWIEHLHTLPNRKTKALFLYEALLTLPIPVAFEEKKRWDTIPMDRIPHLLHQFQDLLQAGLPKTSYAQYQQRYLIIHTLYSVATHLSMNYTLARLHGYIPPYTPQLKHLEDNTFSVLFSAEQNRRVSAIETYFTTLRERSACKAPIFPIHEEIDLEGRGLSTLMQPHSSYHRQVENHLCYLSQFLPRSAIIDKEKALAEIWGSDQLCPVYHSLYAFAYLHYAFILELPTTTPKRLKFNWEACNGSHWRIKLPLFNEALHKRYGAQQTVPDLESLRWEEAQPFVASRGSLRATHQHIVYKEGIISTNDAFTGRRPPGCGLNESEWRDLNNMTRHSSLSVTQALQWIPQNLFSLQKNEVREVLTYALFRTGALPQALNEEPHLIDACRQVVKTLLESYPQERPFCTVRLFGIFLGITFEDFAQSPDLSMLQRYEEKLLFFKEGADRGVQELIVMMQLQALAIHPSPNPLKTYRLLYEYKIVSKENYISDESLFYLFHRYRDQVPLLRQRLFATISPHLKDEACNYLVAQELKIKQPLKLSWEGTFPTFHSEDYSVNVCYFKVDRHENVRELVETVTPTEAYDLEEGDEEIGLSSIASTYRKPFSFHRKEGILRSQDGAITITVKDQQYICRRDILLDGEARRCQQIHLTYKEEQKIGQLPSKLSLAVYQIEKSNTLILFSHEEDQAKMRLDPLPSGQMECRLINAEGITLPHTLSTPQESMIRRFFHPDELLCFANPTTHEIGEFYIAPFQLHFRMTENGLESAHCPGYALKIKTRIAQLGHYQDAFLLENKKGAQKVLLFVRKIDCALHRFSRYLKPKAGSYIGGLPRYVTFDVDPLTGRLSHPAVLPNLYLAYILRLQRRYEEAASYLSCLATVTHLSHDIKSFINRFGKIQDHSPAAYAFDMQLFYFELNLQRKMQESHFDAGKKPTSEVSEARVGMYGKYLCALSSDEHSAIPEGMRLTFEQERLIAKTAHNFYKERQIDPPHLFYIRFLLLWRSNHRVEADVPKPEVSLVPDIIRKSLIKPKALAKQLDAYFDAEEDDTTFHCDPTLRLAPHLIFYEEGHLETYFWLYFDKAKGASLEKKVPFDLTLLQLFRHDAPLASLLFYVRHMPDAFPAVQKNDTGMRTLISTLTALDSVRVKAVHATLEEKVVIENAHPSSQVQYTPPLDQPIERRGAQGASEAPNHDLGELLFERWLTTPPTGEPISEDKGSGYREELYKLLQEGDTALYQEERVSYHLKEGAKVSAVKKKLEVRAAALAVQIREERDNISHLCNQTYEVRGSSLKPSEVIHAKSRQAAHQERCVTVQMVVENVILTNNIGWLQQTCPLCTATELQEIVALTYKHLHTQVVHQLTVEALGEITATSPDYRKLAELLHHKLDYSAELYPEIYYMKLKTGKHPRPGQFKVYTFAIQALHKREHRLFQFFAGGGKTSYLYILIALRARMEGLLTLNVAPEAIYSVEKDNYTSRLGELGLKTGILEIGLHTHLTADHFRYICDELRRCQREGISLVVTPQILFALQLHYFNGAVIEKDKEIMFWGTQIFHLLKTSGFAAIDESHQTVNPKVRAIFGSQEPIELSPSFCDIVLQLMKPLLGTKHLTTTRGTSVAQLGRIDQNRLGCPSASEVIEIQQALAVYGAQLWGKSSKDIENYLLDPAAVPPFSSDELAIARHFIQNVLPHLMQMRTEYDHAPSLFSEQEFDTPREHTVGSTSVYQDAVLTHALSIKGTYHRGLTKDQFIFCLKLLTRRSDCQIRRQKALSTFASWVKGTPFEKLSLALLSINDSTTFNALFERLGNSPAVLDFYLKKVILRQPRKSTHLLTSSPVDMMHMFATTCLTSATPLHRDIYSSALQEPHLLNASEVEVIHTARASKNQQRLIIEQPEIFFEEVKTSPQFLNADVILDPGSFLDMPNAKAAKLWLDSNPELAGIFYFDQHGSCSVDQKSRIALLLRKGKKLTFTGSDLKQQLHAHKISLTKKRFGTLFDPAHTESADMPLNHNINALLLFADDMPLHRFIQAVMRLRGFTTPSKNQTITSVIPKILIEKAHLGTQEALIDWLINNSIKKIRETAILETYQEIQHHVQSIAIEQIFQAKDSRDELEKLFGKYGEALIELNCQSPFEQYGQQVLEKPTREVLEQMAKSRYALFGYAIPYDKSPIKALVNQVIERVEKKVSHLSTQKQEVMATVQLKHVQKEKQVQMMKHYTHEHTPRPKNPVTSAFVPGKGINCTHPNYALSRRHERTANTVFKTQIFTERFHLGYDFLDTAIERGEHLMETYLKTVDYLMVFLEEGHKPFALALNNDILATDLRKIREMESTPEVKYRVFITTITGRVIQRGKHELAPHPGEVDMILASEWFQDVCDDAHFLQCEVSPSPRFHKRLSAQREPFESLYKRLLKAHPNPEKISVRSRNLMQGETD